MLRRELSLAKWCYLDEKGKQPEKQDHVCKRVNSELRALETSSNQIDSARKKRPCQELENCPSTCSPEYGPVHAWSPCDYYQDLVRGTGVLPGPRCRVGSQDQPPCSLDAPWQHLLPSDPLLVSPGQKPCWVYCYGDLGTCQHICQDFQNVKPDTLFLWDPGKVQICVSRDK